MKARELAKLLMHSPDAEVKAWCPDTEDWQSVTGLIVDGDPRPFADAGTIKLYTDDDSSDGDHSAEEKR